MQISVLNLTATIQYRLEAYATFGLRFEISKIKLDMRASGSNVTEKNSLARFEASHLCELWDFALLAAKRWQHIAVGVSPRKTIKYPRKSRSDDRNVCVRFLSPLRGLESV